MDGKPSYGWSLLATATGAIVAAVVMAVPSWLWANYVVDERFSAIVGRSEDLSTEDRALLYGGNLLFVFAGLLVWSWATRSIYRAFAGAELNFWDVFFAIAATGILAAIIGFFFPFLGLVIAVFLTPAVVTSWRAAMAPTTVGDRGARDKPLTALRPY
jgi:hypothetical protein